MSKAPYKVGEHVTLNHFVAPNGLAGETYPVSSVINNGTKKNPQWRLYLGGVGYVDADSVSK